MLIEWGAKIDVQNKKSKTALEIVRNSDLKKFLESEILNEVMYINIIILLIGVDEEHSELVKKFRQQDKTYLGEIIRGHISGEKPFASLTSRSVDYTDYIKTIYSLFPYRCVDGYTLLHWAVKIGSFDLTKVTH